VVEMEAGRELDALVAEKVMGLSAPWDENTPCPYCGEIMRYCGQRSWCTSCSEWRYGPYKEYSEDISAAWEVVERLDALGYWFQGRTRFDNEGEHDDGCWAGFTPHLTTGWNGQPDHYTNAPSMPHAICLAALKAVGIDIPD